MSVIIRGRRNTMMIPVMTDNETCVADLDIGHLEG